VVAVVEWLTILARVTVAFLLSAELVVMVVIVALITHLEMDSLLVELVVPQTGTEDLEQAMALLEK
jgi:phosphoglycerate-specific signal transduction histidine kinase